MYAAEITSYGEYKPKKKRLFASDCIRELHRNTTIHSQPLIDDKQKTKGNDAEWFDKCIFDRSGSLTVEYDSTVSSTLSTTDKTMLQSFIGRLKEFISQDIVDVEKIDVFISKEDEITHAVTAIYVNAEADDAMSFWERIETVTSQWLDKQDVQTKGFISDRVITVVRW